LVEVTDSQERKFRLAVDRSTHLLIRSVVITKDEETQQINEDVSIYSNYQLKDSVWTRFRSPASTTDAAPFKSSTTAVNSIPALADEIFDKSSLSKQGSQALAKKSKN